MKSFREEVKKIKTLEEFMQFVLPDGSETSWASVCSMMKIFIEDGGNESMVIDFIMQRNVFGITAAV